MKKFFILFFVSVIGLINAQYDGTGMFEKIESMTDLTDGYYVVTYSNTKAMSNAHNGTLLAPTDITPVDDKINNPVATIVWKIETNGASRTIFSEDTQKFISYTGSSNNIQVVDAVATDNQKWNITHNGSLFVFTNAAVTTRVLQYNPGSPRFVCYTGSQQNLNLYKLNEEPSEDPSIFSNTPSITNLNYIEGNGPSTAQSFEITGQNLTPANGTVSVTAPANFQVSLDNINFSSVVSPIYSDGAFTQNIFVRLSEGLDINTYSGSIIISGGGANDVTVTSSGTVAPTFTIPYSNNFRDSASLNLALAQGFDLNNYSIQTAGGGYTRLEAIGAYLATPLEINDNSSSTGYIKIEFDLATFGAGNNREVQLVLVDDSSNSTTLATFSPASSSYSTYSYILETSSLVGNHSLKVEYTAGTAGSIRFRDLEITEFSSTPTISSSSCDSTINLFHYDLIEADEFAGATNYRFQIGTSTFDSATGTATLANILGATIQFGTDYQISVAAYVDDAWTDFGPECTISTTATPITEIQNYNCGDTIPLLNTPIFFRNGYLVEMYEYRLTNVATSTVLGTIEVNRRSVRLNEFAGVQLATEYNLQARMQHNGTYGDWSAPCSIFTPNTVTTQLRAANCNQTLLTNASPIFALGIVSSSEYGFRVKNLTTDEIGILEIPSRIFRLNQVENLTVSEGTTYEVEVRVNINGVWGPYGTMCTVTTPSTPILLNLNNNISDSISVYPNPFNNEFSILLPKGDAVNIQLFDINGRLIENRNITNEFEITMGQNLNAGVYLVRVEQNGDVQNFKMIKK